MQRLLDEQAAKSTAVDVEVGLHPLAVLENQLIDEAVLALGGGEDLPLQSFDSEVLGVTSQVARDQGGIEVQCVAQLLAGDCGVLRQDELVGCGERRLEAEVLHLRLESVRPGLLPEVIERMPRDRHTERAEGVPVPMPDSHPVAESHAELERRLRMPHEVVQIDGQQTQEVEDRRNGGFADSDRADLRRLDQRDRAAATEHPRQSRGRHPSRRAAPDDGDAADAPLRCRVV